MILPVYNAETHLAFSLSSILLQDFTDFEIIAVNDGSDDESLAILERAAAKDARIRLVDRSHRGLIGTLNEGLDLATGEFIALMDADDIAYPRRFSRQLEAFASDPALALCGTNFDTLYSGGRVLRLGAPNATSSHDLQVLARFCTALRHPTVMFRRGTIPDGMLRYDPAYPCAEDFDLFRRLAESCKLIQIPEPLLAYRLHHASVTSTRFAQMNQTHARILEENLARHYPSAAGTGFERIIDDLSESTVAAGADLIRRLDRLAPLQRPEDQSAFRLGTTTIFFFLLAQIYRGNRLDFASDFIAQCGSRHRIPWHRRMLLDGAAAVPILARWASGAVPVASYLRRAVQSKPLRNVVPDYDLLLQTARL